MQYCCLQSFSNIRICNEKTFHYSSFRKLGKLYFLKNFHLYLGKWDENWPPGLLPGPLLCSFRQSHTILHLLSWSTSDCVFSLYSRTPMHCMLEIFISSVYFMPFFLFVCFLPTLSYFKYLLSMRYIYPPAW